MPTSAPSTRLAIPSVGADVEGATASLRLFAPDGATVQATLVTSEGVATWGGARSLTLEPGVVTDVTVPAGEHGAIEITADAPVLASARTLVPHVPDEGLESDVGYDHVWVAGVNDESSTTMQVISPGRGASLAVYAPIATTLSVTSSDGTTWATVSIPARTVQRVALDAPAGTVLTATGRAAWVVNLSSAEGTSIASLAPVDTTRQDRTIVVVPGVIAP